MPAAPAVRPSARAAARSTGGRLSAIARPPVAAPGPRRSQRQIDFVAFVAAKLKATPQEIAAARDAGRAMRAKLDGLAAASAAARTAPPARRADGLLPFPPDDVPTPAVAPADAAADRRYTRTAA